MEVKVGHHTSNLKRGLSFALVPGSRKRALALAAAEAEAKAEAKRLALAVEEVERRVATDGGLFTKAEFIAFYKGIEEWDAADAVAREKRLAWVESADELESCPALRTSLRSYEDAVARDAHDFWALAALGEAYEVIDRVADAAAHYERALAVNPEAIETRLSLARTLRAMPGSDATTQHVVLEHLTLVTERTAAATLGQRVEAEEKAHPFRRESTPTTSCRGCTKLRYYCSEKSGDQNEWNFAEVHVGCCGRACRVQCFAGSAGSVRRCKSSGGVHINVELLGPFDSR
jgi:tetratricopeptide (TPR) repeat protein